MKLLVAVLSLLGAMPLHAALAARGDGVVVVPFKPVPIVRAPQPKQTILSNMIERARPSSLVARGEGVVVAIIDTGVDYNHPALGGGFGPGFKVRGGYDFAENDADPMDEDGHGTFMAGIIAGEGADLAAIAPKATLLAYRVFDDDGDTDYLTIINAIERAVADGAHVINLSLGRGGTDRDPVAVAVDSAVKRGVIVVAAAGNAGDIATISTPAAASLAVAVGGGIDEGDGRIFRHSSSSMGPTTVSMTLKPDVLAPWWARSTDLGGATSEGGGTSVATAHVSGMTAILRELHADWTPADVKSALVTTAQPVYLDYFNPGWNWCLADTLHPMGAGGGWADLETAAAASVFASETGLMFGLHGASSGVGLRHRTVTLHNRSSSPQTFVSRIDEPLCGFSITVTPAEVTIPPRSTATVAIDFSIDYRATKFPESLVIGGSIVLQNGESRLRLPWAFMRGARVSIESSFGLDRYHPLFAFGHGKVHLVYPWAPPFAEMWVKPGRWDFMASEARRGPTHRVVLAEDQLIEGDHKLVLRGAAATVRLDVEATDERGMPLRSLPVDGGRRYDRLLLTDYEQNGVRYEMPAWLYADTAIMISPAAKRFTFVVSESYIDPNAMRVFSVLHRPLRNATTSTRMTQSIADYGRVTIELPPVSTSRRMCVHHGYTTKNYIGTEPRCVMLDKTHARSLELYAADDSAFAFQGLFFNDDVLTTPLIRRLGREFVLTPVWENGVPSRVSYRSPLGSPLRFGMGPVHGENLPYAGWTSEVDSSGLFGPLGERHAVSSQSVWDIYDQSGTRTRSGRVTFDEQLRQWAPGDRYVQTNDAVRVRGRAAPVVDELRFGGSPSWYGLPSITSLRIVDATGSATDRLRAGRTAWLEFSARSYERGYEHRTAMRSEATRVWFQRTGTQEWQRLGVVITGLEKGSYLELGHHPAGDMYRVDLTPALGIAGPVDLRIEAEDELGNHLGWTQTAAFVVLSPWEPRDSAPLR